jgi:hypothetical protein
VPRLYPAAVTGSQDDPGRWRHAYVDPTRSGVRFWVPLRLQIHLRIGPDPRRGQPDRRKGQSAIVDTGAYLTVFAQNVWSGFDAGLIQFLDPAPQTTPIPISVAGHRCPVRLGWIWLGVEDRERPVGRLPARRVLAQFAEDGGRLKRTVLVGLWESVLTGRRLVGEPTLEPDEPDPLAPARRRPTFGQVWRLTAG